MEHLQWPADMAPVHQSPLPRRHTQVPREDCVISLEANAFVVVF